MELNGIAINEEPINDHRLVWLIAVLDGMTMGELANDRLWATRALLEPAVVIDLAADIAIRPRSLSDALTTSDAGVQRFFTVAATQALATSDSGLDRVWYWRAMLNVLDTSDVLSRTWLRRKVVQEAFDLTDTTVKTVTRLRALADALAVTELVSGVYVPGVAIFVRTLADTLVMDELLTKVLVTSGAVFVKNQLEGIEMLADPLTKALRLTRSLQDASGPVGDSLARALVRGRVQQDVLATDEAFTKQFRLTRTLQDGFDVLDALTKVVVGSGQVNFKIIADALDMSEAQARVWLRTRALSDALTVVDTLGSALLRLRFVVDVLTALDTTARTLSYRRSVADVSTLIDSLIKLYVPALSPHESNVRLGREDLIVLASTTAGLPQCSYERTEWAAATWDGLPILNAEDSRITLGSTH